MTARLLAKLTYANVVSTLAVFLLLGGGAYAASELAANSVGSRELKNNAVTSAEVKKGSLQASDFADGQLPVGQTGPQGAQGPPGAPGPQGLTGGSAIQADGSDLLDPSTDLPGGKAVISIDGVEFAANTAFRIGCPTPTSCAVSVAKPVDTSLAYEQWFEAAQVNPGAAKKSFSLIVSNGAGTVTQRYHVENGLPTSLFENGTRMVLTLHADAIQRVSL